MAGVSEARGMTLNIASSFYRSACALDAAAPWTLPAQRFHAFGMTVPAPSAAGTTTVVVQLIGSSGTVRGIATHPSFAAYRSFVEGGDGNSECTYMLFTTPNACSAKEVALFTAACGGGGSPDRQIPELRASMGRRAATLADVSVIDAAMQAATRFFVDAVSIAPTPGPPPLPTYGFAPCAATIKVVVCSGEVDCQCVFPAGDWPVSDRLTNMGATHGSPITRYTGVLRPATVRTIGQCVEYHRATLSAIEARPLIGKGATLNGLSKADLNGAKVKIVAWDAGAQRLQVRLHESQTVVKVKLEKCSVDAGQTNESELDVVRHSKEFKGHTYALAKALWDREEIDATNEAIDVSTKLLDLDPSDNDFKGTYKVRYFILNLLLELGRWEDTVQHLLRFPEERSADWYWSTALVYLKSRGMASKKALKAIALATTFNPHVYDYLLGDTPMPVDGTAYTLTSKQDVVPGRSLQDATNYVKEHAKHWRFNGLLEAVREAGKAASEAFKTRGQHERMDEATWDEVTGRVTVSAREFVEDIADGIAHEGPNDTSKLLCAQCGQFGGRLKKCGACGSVSYCSAECQKLHWPTHKGPCKAARNVGQAAKGAGGQGGKSAGVATGGGGGGVDRESAYIKAYSMGGGLEEMGDIAGSMAEYKKCLAIEEHVYKDANVHYELGRLYSKQNNLPEAIKHNRRCLELNPHLVECVVNLGNCLGRTGDTQGAIDMYRKSIALNSSTTNWNGRFMLAQTLYISGRERMTPQLLKQGAEAMKSGMRSVAEMYAEAAQHLQVAAAGASPAQAASVRQLSGVCQEALGKLNAHFRQQGWPQVLSKR